MSIYLLAALGILLVVSVAVFRILIGRGMLRGFALPEATKALPYRSCGTLLTKGEYAFYRELSHLTADQYIVSMKVRLSDVITCPREAWKGGYQGKISQKHLDFVLCDLESARILLAIELDDRSHGRADRRKRDEFLDAAMAAAGVPLLRFRAAASYDPKRIADAIDAALNPAATVRRAG